MKAEFRSPHSILDKYTALVDISCRLNSEKNFDQLLKLIADEATKHLDAERTFWEKATILHQEAHRGPERPLPIRYSRHYYDVYRLSLLPLRNDALAEIELSLGEVQKYILRGVLLDFAVAIGEIAAKNDEGEKADDDHERGGSGCAAPLGDELALHVMEALLESGGRAAVGFYGYGFHGGWPLIMQLKR